MPSLMFFILASNVSYQRECSVKCWVGGCVAFKPHSID